MDDRFFGDQVLSTRPTSPQWRVRGARQVIPDKSTPLFTPGPDYDVTGCLDVDDDRLNKSSSFKKPPRTKFGRSGLRDKAQDKNDPDVTGTPGPGEYRAARSCGATQISSRLRTAPAFSLSAREKQSMAPGRPPIFIPADENGPGRCRTDTAFTTARSSLIKQGPAFTLGQSKRFKPPPRSPAPGPGYYDAGGGGFGRSAHKRNNASWSLTGRWRTPPTAWTTELTNCRMDTPFKARPKAGSEAESKAKGFTFPGRPKPKLFDTGTPGPGAYGKTFNPRKPKKVKQFPRD